MNIVQYNNKERFLNEEELFSQATTKVKVKVKVSSTPGLTLLCYVPTQAPSYWKEGWVSSV